jgi:hypothetical protein
MFGSVPLSGRGPRCWAVAAGSSARIDGRVNLHRRDLCHLSPFVRPLGVAAISAGAKRSPVVRPRHRPDPISPSVL